MRTFAGILIVMTGLVFPTGAANRRPVVSAGNDTTLRLGYAFILDGTASDDSLPNDTLKVQWNQVAGPNNGITLYDPGSARAVGHLNAVGVYTFVLTAFDGEFTVADSTVVTVLDSIPFRVLTPRAGERISRGSSFLVTWQIDPPASIRIRLSRDGGKSYEQISGAIGGAETSWIWAVPDTLPAAEDYIIQVQNYFERDKTADSDMFSITADGIGVVNGRLPPGTAARVQAENSGVGRYSPNGRHLRPAVGHAEGRTNRAAAFGVAVRRLSDNSTGAPSVSVVQ